MERPLPLGFEHRVVEYLCVSDHAHDDPLRLRISPVLTIVERRWGWCPADGTERHDWRHLTPTPLQALRSGVNEVLRALRPELRV